MSQCPPRLKIDLARKVGLGTRVGTTAGQHYQAVSDPDHAFEFGLQRVLDGIEVLVQDRVSGRAAS